MAWPSQNLVPQMSHLNLEERELHILRLPSTHKAKFMTGGDPKETTQKAEKILQQTGNPSTPENMFLAVVSTLNPSSVILCIHVFLMLLPRCFPSFYWSYVINPPLWKPVTWVDGPFPIFSNATNLVGGIPMPVDTPHVNSTFWTSVSTNFTFLPLCVSTTNILHTRPMIQMFLQYIPPHDNQRANLTYLSMGSISHGDITTDLSHSNLLSYKQNSKWTPSSGQIIWESCRGYVPHVSWLGPYSITN